MSRSTSIKSVFGGTMLITGCCIGAGMIGLPIKSALAGLLPSTVVMILCYIFTTITGLLIAEATLWFKNKINFPTIVEATLGKTGKFLALFLFLALFYSLFVAYLDGCGMIFSDLITSMIGYPVPKIVGITICMILVAGITYTGTHLADRFNQLLMVGLLVSYILLIVLGLMHAHQPIETHISLMPTLNVIPIMLICFGFQNLVPSLTYYLEKNVNHIRFAIIVGNFIPLLTYALWNYVILGILPAHASVQSAEIISQLLQNTLSIISIIVLIKSFSLFAMLTSFIPCAISLVDFIKDGMRVSLNATVKNELFYLGLIFIPSFIFTLIYPRLFLTMLDFAGGFVDVLLFGVLPAVVILIGRKTMVGQSSSYQVFGGNITPILVIITSLIILLIKITGFF